MANKLLEPDTRENQDSRHNPGQDGFDDLIQNTYSKSEQDHARNLPAKEQKRLDDIAAKEENSRTSGDKNASRKDVTDLSARENSPVPASIPVTVSGIQKAAAKKITGKQKGLVGGLIGLIITIIGTISLLGPFLGIVNLKEVAVNKFVKDQMATYEPRTNIIMRYKTVPGGAPETNFTCNVKVKCRFIGTSAKSVEKLRKAGFTIESEPINGHPLKYQRITSWSYTVNGETVDVTPSNYDRLIRTNPTFNKMVRTAYKPRIAVYGDKLARSAANKLGIFRGNQLGDAKNEKELRSAQRKNIKGQSVDADGRIITTRDPNDPNAAVAENAEKLGEIGENITEEAEDLAEAFDDPEQIIESVPEVDGKVAADAAVQAGRGALRGAILGPIDIANSACTVYYMLAAVGFGAKVIANEQMIRYYYTFANTADAIKAGNATPQQVAYLGNTLTTKDENGKTFSDSLGYNWMATDKLNDTTETMKYKLGGGLTGSLVGFKAQLDNLGAGQACGVITNPFVQVGAFFAYLAGTIFTGGTLTAGSIATSASVAAGFGIAQAVMTPLLVRLVAGTIVTGDENGKDAANAFTAGGGAFASFMGRARGMVPLTRVEAITYDKASQETIAMTEEVEKLDASPFDVTNPLTPSGKMYASIAGYAMNPVSSQTSMAVASLAANPFSMLSSVASIFSPKTSAAIDEYAVCTDPEYRELDLATDPFCNPKYGFDLTTINSPEYAPETVIDKMLAKQWIDNDGNIVPGSEYEEFIAECINNDKPLSPTQSEETLPKRCFDERNTEDQKLMRMEYIDRSIYEGMLQYSDGLDVAADGSGTESGNSGGVQEATGNDQQLAQQILDSGKVQGANNYMQQIRDYAAGNFSCNINPEILKLIATASQNHELYITSLNRNCTGVLTASGTRSRHYTAGGGHAVDFGIVDGVASTGSTAKDVALLRELIPTLPAGTEIGQVNCRSGANVLSVPTSFRQVNDTCNHIHIGVTPR